LKIRRRDILFCRWLFVVKTLFRRLIVFSVRDAWRSPSVRVRVFTNRISFRVFGRSSVRIACYICTVLTKRVRVRHEITSKEKKNPVRVLTYILKYWEREKIASRRDDFPWSYYIFGRFSRLADEVFQSVVERVWRRVACDVFVPFGKRVYCRVARLRTYAVRPTRTGVSSRARRAVISPSEQAFQATNNRDNDIRGPPPGR